MQTPKSLLSIDSALEFILSVAKLVSFFLWCFCYQKKTPPPNRDKLGQTSLLVTPYIKYNTGGEVLWWIFLNQHLFFVLLWLCLLTFVCFPHPQEPPYFTAEPQDVILAEVEKDVDILCQAMGESAKVFQPGLMACACPVLKTSSRTNHLCKLLMSRSLCVIADYCRSHTQGRGVAFPLGELGRFCNSV